MNHPALQSESDWAFAWFLFTFTPAQLTDPEWLLFRHYQENPSNVY